MIGNINSLRRQVKNVAYNFSDAQIKVREATSNDPWGPSSSLMSEIADMTYNTMAFAEIMQMVWKRLNDHGKNWRHVYKSLVLLDYLIKVGSERVSQQCRENIYAIQTLRDFQHIEENRDQGMNVREKAKQLVNLLKDDERLKNERARALMAKRRFAQNGMGIGSDGSRHSFGRSDTYYGGDEDYDYSISYADGAPTRSRRNGMRRGVSVPNIRSELEECRPASMGEEELQLQIALALSKEEAQKEDELRKHDDLRFQLALEESKKLEKRHSIGSEASPRMVFASMGASARASARASGKKKGSAIDDLLSLQPAFDGVNASDPFATPRGAGANHMDPWGAPFAAASANAPLMDPWGDTGSLVHPTATAATSPLSQGGMQTSDPWGLDPLKSALPEDNGGATASKTRAATKTPDHFLGENSALVNLDNLMGPAKPAIHGVPPRVATVTSNPFAGGTGFSSGNSMAPNPFLAQTGPSQTLNEMRQQMSVQQQPQAAAWQPLQPQPPASSTNPFL